MASSQRHEVLIVGGGSAGISVAARLRRAGLEDVGLVDPATTHYYQPLWTLVGGGCAPLAESARPQAKQVPRGVRWHRKAATAVDPGARTVTLSDGEQLEYRYLVMCPGIQLDWAKIPGLSDTLGRDGVSSNYTYETAPKMWEFIRALRSGTAIFGMPSGPIKCAGAPQKIAYLAADYWRQQGVLDDIRVVLVLPTPGMFGVAVFAKELEMVAKRYGIEVRFNSEVVAVDAPTHRAVIADKAAGTQEALRYDVMHLVPPQSAPDWVKASPLADTSTPNGYVEVDKHTLQHVRHPEVFALGDAGSSPNSKTGAAIRKQAPVVVQNLRDVRAGRTPTAHYDGYSSCPLTTARNKMLLAEFDYTMQPTPSIPFIDTTRERRDMWYLKRYGLPFLYWNLMLKGRA
jgi:sulfide:quinone oxidoreductase